MRSFFVYTKKMSDACGDNQTPCTQCTQPSAPATRCLALCTAKSVTEDIHGADVRPQEVRAAYNGLRCRKKRPLDAPFCAAHRAVMPTVTLTTNQIKWIRALESMTDHNTQPIEPAELLYAVFHAWHTLRFRDTTSRGLFLFMMQHINPPQMLEAITDLVLTAFHGLPPDNPGLNRHNMMGLLQQTFIDMIAHNLQVDQYQTHQCLSDWKTFVRRKAVCDQIPTAFHDSLVRTVCLFHRDNMGTGRDKASL